jgi:hypothetical protein
LSSFKIFPHKLTLPYIFNFHEYFKCIIVFNLRGEERKEGKKKGRKEGREGGRKEGRKK